jgi:hypothetical protein
MQDRTEMTTAAVAAALLLGIEPAPRFFEGLTIMPLQAEMRL